MSGSLSTVKGRSRTIPIAGLALAAVAVGGWGLYSAMHRPAPADTVLLAWADLPPEIGLMAGGEAIGPHDRQYPVRALPSGDFPRVWLTGPFLEPKEITKNVERTAAGGKIEILQLKPLAKAMKPRAIPVSREGPVTTFGPFVAPLVDWAGPSLLYLDPGRIPGNPLVGMLDVVRGQAIEVEGVTRPLTSSPDGTRVGLIRDRALIVRDLAEGLETSYDLSTVGLDGEATVSWLTWSTDQRYILGDWTRGHTGAPGWPSTLESGLWAVDLDSSAAALLESSPATYTQPQWAPDGYRAAVRRTKGSYYEVDGIEAWWLEVDPANGTVRQAGRQPERTACRLDWTSGQLKATLPGFGGLRAQGFDPTTGVDSDGILALMPFTATHLRLLDAEGRENFRIDLRPALAKAGVTIGEWFFFTTNWSPDGRYLLLTGESGPANGGDDLRHFTGVLDMTTRQVRFLPPDASVLDQKFRFLTADPDSDWNGTRVILPYGYAQKRQIRALDAATLTTAVVAEGPTFTDARWFGEDILYVATDEAGLAKPDGTRRVLLRADPGETLQPLPTSLISPDGHHFSIRRSKPDGHGLVWTKIDVIDLDDLK